MVMKNLQACLPSNYGWLEAKLDQTDIDHLWECIDTITYLQTGKMPSDGNHDGMKDHQPREQ